MTPDASARHRERARDVAVTLVRVRPAEHGWAIEMAREDGALHLGFFLDQGSAEVYAGEIRAALDSPIATFASIIEAEAREGEREACARTAEGLATYEAARREGFGHGAWQVVATRIAREIRQRAASPEPSSATREGERASLRSVLAPLRELAEKVGPLPVKRSGALMRFDGQCGKVYHDGCLVADFGTASPAHHETQTIARLDLVCALVNALPALLKIADASAGTEPSSATPSVSPEPA